MTLTPRIRKITLTLHVITSIGWLGAVVCFLVLAIIGLTNPDSRLVSSIYLVLELITISVILPLCFASLITGLVLSLGTEWGLFRHYWVLIKLVIIALSTIVLLIHLQPISYMARVAEGSIANEDTQIQLQLVVASGLALLVLVLVTALSIFKPRGLTPYGWRKLRKTNLNKH